MDLSANTSLAGLAEAVATVQVATSFSGNEVFITGALARDLWLEFGHGLDTGRITQDVDFGIACASWQAFDHIAQELESKGLQRDSRRQHRFRHPNGTEIDLLPFGGIEGAGRTIAWPPNGDTVMNLVGFEEASRATVPFLLPGKITVHVVSLPALAVLKLLAWEDRRHGPARNKDARDLVLIATHYLEVREPQLSTDLEAALLEHNDYEDRLASVELLGLDMATLGSEAVRSAINEIFDREVDPDGPLHLARIVNSYDPLAALGFVAALRSGFLQSNSNTISHPNTIIDR
jgi:predicted nucleotidyltransferase